MIKEKISIYREWRFFYIFIIRISKKIYNYIYSKNNISFNLQGMLRFLKFSKINFIQIKIVSRSIHHHITMILMYILTEKFRILSRFLNNIFLSPMSEIQSQFYNIFKHRYLQFSTSFRIPMSNIRKRIYLNNIRNKICIHHQIHRKYLNITYLIIIIFLL